MLKKGILLHIIIIIFAIGLLAACQKSAHQKDLSEVKLTMSSVRFEQDLFNCSSVMDIEKLALKHPDFYPIYTQSILGSVIMGPNSTSQDVAVELYRYIAHKDMDSLYKITQSKYADFEPYRAKLEKASKYIHTYFPDERIERVTTFISAFQYGSVFDQQHKAFGVGLDMYLGADFEVYKLLDPQSFPAYRVSKFEAERIVPNCIQTFVDYKMGGFEGTNFIEQAIFEGKKLYLLDLLLPEFSDALKINYTEEQLKWATNQESNMWSYLVEKEVLFNSNKNDYQKHYFNDGPFTTPFGNESAPRIGPWIGWQIVRKYMDKNPNVTIHQLIADKNHQAIFQKSGYRP
jgi:hypothetical protein